MPAELAPVHDVELERSVLGCFMLDPERSVVTWRAMTAGFKQPLHLFFKSAHVAIATVCLDLYAKGIYPDYTSTAHELRMRGALDEVGGLGYLCEMDQYVWNTFNVAHYIRQLTEMWQKRELQRIAIELPDEINDSTQNINELLRVQSDRMRQLQVTRANYDTPENEVLVEMMEAMSQPDDDGRFALPCVHAGLQRKIGGFRRGYVAIVAAVTGWGKTCEALHQGFYLARTHRKHVLAFLLESTYEQVLQRWTMQTHGFDGRKFNDLTRKSWNARDKERFFAAVKAFAELRGYWNGWYNKSMSGPEVEAEIQSWCSATGKQPDFVIVDTVNRMKSPNPKWGMHEHAAITANMETIAAVAARYNCAVLAPMQLTKETYAAGLDKNKLPTLGCLKGSGTPAENAKVVYFLHKDDKEMLGESQVVDEKFVVAKANDGQQGVVPGMFIKHHGLHLEATPDNVRDYRELLGDWKPSAHKSNTRNEDSMPCYYGVEVGV